MSSSKKITELSEAVKEQDYNKSFFVIANTDSNKKISYKILKDSILKNTGIEKYTPSYLSDFNNLPITEEEKALTAKGGKIIATALNTYIPKNSSTTVSVTTPLLFPNNTSLKTNQIPRESNDVVNLEYLNNRITPAFFNDFQTKDYIYGNEILTTIGKPLKFNTSNPNNWVVTGTLPIGERNSNSGWQKMDTTLLLKPNKKISDYKKIILIVADEEGGASDTDTQLFAYSFDCGEYIYTFKKYKERLNVFNTINTASSNNPVTVKVCNQKITWKDKNLRTKNYADYVYISPNYYAVNNVSVYNTHLILKYTENYDNTITSAYGGFLVAIIGLK